MPAALRPFTLVVLLAALLGAAKSAAQDTPPRILGPTVSDRVMVQAHDVAVQARAVQPDFAAIEALARRHLDVGEFATFVMDLFDGVELEAEVVSAEVRSTGTTLYGRLVDDELGSVVLTYEGGVLVGTVSLPGASYMIERQPDGLYRVARMATQLFPPELQPQVLFLPAPAPNPFAAPDIPADSGRLIDVLVVFTPEAQTAAGGAGGMAALVQAMIDGTNQINRNSGVAHRMRLVHSESVAYTLRSSNCQNPFLPPGSFGNNIFSCALNDLTGTADGFMDNVHELRNTHGADLVALIIEDNSSCGLAWLPSPPSAVAGFSVSARACAHANRTFAHESGHNLGAHHDPYPGALGTGPNPCGDGFIAGAFCYSRGIVNVAQQWRTVLAYTNQCDDNATTCPKIDFFSNPMLTHMGSPIGTAAFNNNAHTLNKTAKAVASYRPNAAMHPIPQRFGDVAASHAFYGYIEFFGQAGITTGCGSGLFCPDGTVTRRAMAAFLERVKRAPEWTPPVAVGLFPDVPTNDAFAPWIEALFNDGITSGCAGGGFCPDDNVTRGQMAVFILRARCGAGYVPNLPAVQRFTDVPPSYAFYRFIDKLAALNITGGCNTVPAMYCPENPVTRGQMAVFIERAFPFLAPSETCAP